MSHFEDIINYAVGHTAPNLTVSGLPEGLDALFLVELCQRRATENNQYLNIHIASDEVQAQRMIDLIRFFGPNINILHFPAWDCLPYDRVSPKASTLATRIDTLSNLIDQSSHQIATPTLIVTSINAILQRTLPPAILSSARLNLKAGGTINESALLDYLSVNGYTRTDQVMEPGDYAIRGGLIDIFPPSSLGEDAQPYRLDLFGDEIETIRAFDPLTQRTTNSVDTIKLLPANELLLNENTIARFKHGYRAAFGAVYNEDPIFEAVSAKRKFQGMEHWLPLFHEKMATLFDYAPNALISLDYQVGDAAKARLDLIADYYQARSSALKEATKLTSVAVYKALPPETLYLGMQEWLDLVADNQSLALTPFNQPESDTSIDAGGNFGRDFAPDRKAANANIYDLFRDHLTALHKQRKDVIFACYSKGSLSRIETLFRDHGIKNIETVSCWSDVVTASQKTPQGKPALYIAVLGLEKGFETESLAFTSEIDLLGDRLIRKSRQHRKAEDFITEASALNVGDLVVHINHGIGRFNGLKTIDVQGAPHDCLNILYAGGDKLFLPVENIEMLSRFGSDSADVPLDKLGGVNWQKRHAILKKRIREIADELIKVAAARTLKSATSIAPPDGLYDEFCARFPYPETEDQRSSILDVIDDLQSGRPMDRLICGDVGFGKTEVALRAAFLAAINGLQVAVITPTTLLCRQHMQTFAERFDGLPVRIAQISRLVSQKEANQTKAALAEGQIDIIIGTHALLSKNIKFKNLGLIIIDEEQHFGVVHKERLKQLKADLHVLTLTATPIPRTLQLAMSGMRELSLIASPPIDRLAVRTFISPFDEIVVREALMREHFRGGQSYFVCPRIADIGEIATFLREQVPELKFIIAHGQMPATQIEDTMNAFYDGQYDILLATTIIESGLDIPRVNTMIIHRADMFGLAQLYQLRGRVGRSKIRAYAYLTIPNNRILTANAEKRLQVLQSLDTLGAGFTLASHDLDIRGAGNLLGEEQSGNIREVGLELYQQMLEQAVAEAKQSDDADSPILQDWSPQINIGASVLIPEHYVKDLTVRMGLYRRLGDIKNDEDLNGFAAELIDRFGPLPDEVKQLLSVFKIKHHCVAAAIEKMDAGPKGVIISFRNDSFKNPAGLINYLSKQSSRAKLRPDHKLVILVKWNSPEARLQGCAELAEELATIAGAC